MIMDDSDETANACIDSEEKLSGNQRLQAQGITALVPGIGLQLDMKFWCAQECPRPAEQSLQRGNRIAQRQAHPQEHQDRQPSPAPHPSHADADAFAPGRTAREGRSRPD